MEPWILKWLVFNLDQQVRNFSLVPASWLKLFGFILPRLRPEPFPVWQSWRSKLCRWVALDFSWQLGRDSQSLGKKWIIAQLLDLLG